MESDTDYQFSVVYEEADSRFSRFSGFTGFSSVYEEVDSSAVLESQGGERVSTDDLSNQTYDKSVRKDVRYQSIAGRSCVEREVEEEGAREDAGVSRDIGERTIQLNSLEHISRFLDEVQPSNVERGSGVDAIVVKSWGDVLLTGIGLFGAVCPENEVSVHVRVFSNSNLVWQSCKEAWKVNQWGTIHVEPPLLLASRGRYLIVARIAGGPI